MLPSIHQAWSPIISRLKEMLLILQYYYSNFGRLNQEVESSPSKIGSRDKSLLALESNNTISPFLTTLGGLEKKCEIENISIKTVTRMNHQDSMHIENPLYDKAKLHLISDIMVLTLLFYPLCEY